MKVRALLAIVVAVVIACAVYWLERRGDDARTVAATPGASVSSGTPSARAAGPTPDSRVPARLSSGRGSAERAAMLEAIAKARSRRTSAPRSAPHTTGASAGEPTDTTLDIVDKTGDTSAWSKRALATLDSLLGQCYDLGRAEDPTLAGTIALQFKIVGEPDVGGLLERVEIVDDKTSITQQTIRDCMIQQLYALELDPPPEGMSVEREISLQFP